MPENEFHIPVFMSCDDNYAPHLCAVIASATGNSASKFHFHILHDGLSTQAMSAIAKAADGHKAEFIRVDRALFSKFDVKLSHLTLEACFRYMIPEIRPEIDKAIYLDCDVTVLGDLKEFYDTDISGFYAGVGEDFVKKSYVEKLGLKRYFNSGSMLFNTALMRRDGMTEKLFKTSEALSGASKFLDQDALNIVFKDRAKFVPLKWNATAPLYRKKVNYGGPTEEVEEAVYSPGVVHFTGPDKPWKIPYGPTAHPYAPAYFHYLRKTPYAAKEQKILAEFKPLPRFMWYFKRHLFFFMRPAFFKMRALYAANRRKYE